jgi:predicted ester cyclase
MKGTSESEKSLSQFNKEVVRRYIKAWEQADLMTLGELIAEDFVNHSPPLPPNRQAMLEFAVEHRSQFPTGRYTLQTLVAEDDLVFAFGHYQGTHDGEAFMDIPASGAEANFDCL